MSRLALLLSFCLAAMLAACPTTPCAISAPSQTPSKVFGIVGHPVSVVAVQPTSTCAAPGARVTATLIDPGNRHVTDFTLTSESDLSPTATLVFTPKVAGNWQLILNFDPSHGRVQLPIDVADERLSTPRVPVFVSYDPHLCTPQPFKTRNGLVLCELRGRIHTMRPGADEVVFDGEALTVLGNTVWWSHSGDLIRSTDTGAELVRDAVAHTPGVPSTTRAFTNEVTAIRAFDSGVPLATLVRYDFIDGGLTRTELATNTADRFYVSDGGLYRLTHFQSSYYSNDAFCPVPAVDGGCTDLGGAAYSLDSSGLWVPQTPSTGAVDLIPPPYLGVPSASFVYGEHWVPYPQLRTTANDGDRPMVDPEAFGLGMPGEQARVIVRRLGGDFTLTSYGNGELLGTRGDTLVMLLPDPVGSNRIVFIDY